MRRITSVVMLLCMLISLCSCGGEKKGEGLADIGFTLTLSDEITTPVKYWGDGISTYYFFLPSGTTPEDITVSTENGITLRRDGDSIQKRRKFKNGKNLIKIECDVKYLLGCYDEKNYLYELPVVFKSGANIHSVFITTESGSMSQVLADKNYKEKAKMIVADKDAKIKYNGDLSHIKGRGNGSWYSHKKPFNIKLSEAFDLLGMGSSREWCLLSQESDPTNIRNKLSFDMAREAGMKYSPDSEFADLWIDGEYFGLYLLTDRINISPASVDIFDLEKATEAVNLNDLDTYPPAVKSIPGLFPTVPMNLHHFKIPNDPADITGGYLIELDKFYAQEKDSYFNTDRTYYFTLKSPEETSERQISYIYQLLNEMECAIDGEAGDYKQYIDIKSWAEMFVLQELLANGDFMGSSQYFYKEPDVNGVRSRIFAGPVWDMDLILGNEPHNIAPNVLMSPNKTWVEDLYTYPEFKAQMLSAYSTTFAPLAKKLIDGGIDEYVNLIRASSDMNFTRWQSVLSVNGENPQQAEISKIKQYLTDRTAMLDDMWVSGKWYHSVKVTDDPVKNAWGDYFYLDYMVERGAPLGELKVPDEDGYVFEGWFYGTPENPGAAYNPQAPVSENIMVFAKYRKK